MSQNQSGEKSFVEQQLDKVLHNIEEQYDIFKLEQVVVDDSAVVYFNMTEKELYSLTPYELGMAELKLNSYAFTVQKHCNRATTIKNWAEKCLSKVVASEYSDYIKINAYMKYDVMRQLVVKNNTVAYALDKIIDENELMINQFMYLSQSIQQVADSFGKLARFRGKQNESIG